MIFVVYSMPPNPPNGGLFGITNSGGLAPCCAIVQNYCYPYSLPNFGEGMEMGLLFQKRIILLFKAYGCFGTVSAKNHSFFGQRQKFSFDVFGQLFKASSRKIGPANASVKKLFDKIETGGICESLANLYLMTGDKKYLKTAEFFVQDSKKQLRRVSGQVRQSPAKKNSQK